MVQSRTYYEVACETPLYESEMERAQAWVGSILERFDGMVTPADVNCEVEPA